MPLDGSEFICRLAMNVSFGKTGLNCVD